MEDYKDYTASFSRLTATEWVHVAFVVFLYVALEILAEWGAPALALHPGFALAVGFLFFKGLRFLPFIFLAVLVSSIARGAEIPEIGAYTVAATIIGGTGAWLLVKRNVDPIFRRNLDVLNLTGIIALISLVYPMAKAIASLGTIPLMSMLEQYVATAFVLIVLLPFILRWVAKPRFGRTTREIMETTAVMALVVAISALYFLFSIETVAGISLLYFLLLPLLWIAIRLRPRFVTLSLLITSLCALSGIVLRGGQFPMTAFEVELFMVAASGTLLVITSLEEHRRANANRFLAQMATLENVVARVKSESQAKNDFIAILAHELRNPLAPVVSGIELLQLQHERDPEEMKTLASMGESLMTVRLLLNDLLDVSRISEGKIMLHKEVLSIETVLDKALLSTEHYRKERHQNLVITNTATHKVYADPVRLEQVFSNLFTNASKYSDSGSTITVSARNDDDFVEVEVADEGIGLEPDALERIFLPFEQINRDTRAKGGLGIGLALVRDFVRMHGGTVRVESPGHGQGSRFIVRLPRHNPAATGA